MFSGAVSRNEAVQETRPPGLRFLVVLEASMAGSGHAGGGAAEDGRAKFSILYTKTPEIRFVSLE